MGLCISCVAQLACGMACGCCKGILNATMPQMSRIGHILVVGLTFLVAVILGKNYPDEINGYNSYSKVKLDTECTNGYDDDCIYRQLVYRASFALFLVFLILAVGSAASDFINKSFWTLKFFVPVALFVGFWWGDNSFFSGWAEVTRVLSFFWLLVQAFLLFDFAHDVHDVIMQKSDEADSGTDESGGRKWKAFYILLSLGCLTAVIVGLVFLFQDYAGCDLGAFFTSVTIVMGVITTCVSLLDVVRKGFLTPMVMFAYAVFMCWYALLSSPIESCNPTTFMNEGHKKDTALGVIICVTAAVLLYCVAYGTVILNVFNPEGEGVIVHGTGKSKTKTAGPELSGVLSGENKGDPENNDFDHKASVAAGDDDDEPSGTAHERVFFHVLMILLICYTTMILTSWGKTNGEPEGYGSNRVGNESMWLKILSQWVFIALQCRALWVAYQENSSA